MNEYYKEDTCMNNEVVAFDGGVSLCKKCNGADCFLNGELDLKLDGIAQVMECNDCGNVWLVDYLISQTYMPENRAGMFQKINQQRSK